MALWLVLVLRELSGVREVGVHRRVGVDGRGVVQLRFGFDGEDGWEGPRRRVLNGADDGVGFELLSRDELEDGQADLFHVLGEMDRQLLPGRERLPAEPTWLVVRHPRRVFVTLLDLLPSWVLTAGALDGRLGLDLWLG